MCACADSQVVAEFPVVEVMAAAPSRAREGRGLVVLEARRAEVIRASQAVRQISDELKRLINEPNLPVADETLIVPLDEPVDLLRLADFFELPQGQRLEQVPVPSSLENRTLAEADLRDEYGFNILAVVRPIPLDRVHHELLEMHARRDGRLRTLDQVLVQDIVREGSEILMEEGIDKGRCVGFRWPKTAPLPATAVSSLARAREALVVDMAAIAALLWELQLSRGERRVRHPAEARSRRRGRRQPMPIRVWS